MSAQQDQLESAIQDGMGNLDSSGVGGMGSTLPVGPSTQDVLARVEELSQIATENHQVTNRLIEDMRTSVREVVDKQTTLKQDFDNLESLCEYHFMYTQEEDEDHQKILWRPQATPIQTPFVSSKKTPKKKLTRRPHQHHTYVQLTKSGGHQLFFCLICLHSFQAHHTDTPRTFLGSDC